MTDDPLKTLMEGLEGIQNGDPSYPLKTLDPEAQILEVEAVSKYYEAGASRFKVGDWVMFRTNGYRKDAGEPHQIVELRENAGLDFKHSKSPDAMTFGARYTVRVMECTQGRIVCFWCEAWELDPYSP